MSQATPTLDLAVSAQLIEDYLDIADLPSPALGDGEIAAISDGVFIVDGGNVLLVERSGSRSTGWSHTTIAVPLPQTAKSRSIVKLRAFEVPGQMEPSVTTRIVNLICLFPTHGDGLAASWLRRVDQKRNGVWIRGAWETAKVDTRARGLLSQVTQLDVVDCGFGCGTIVYGITNAIFGWIGNATVFTIGADYNDLVGTPWTVKSTTSQRNLPTTDPEARIAIMAIPSSAEASAPLSLAICCYVGSAMWTAQMGTDLALPLSFDYRLDDLAGQSVTQWVGAPVDRWSDAAVPGLPQWTAYQIDGNGVLWRLAIGDRFTDSTSLLAVAPGQAAPGSVIHFVLATHGGGTRSGFALDGTGTLWLLRDVTSATPAWSNLGSAVSNGTMAKAVACPPATQGALQVYYATGDDAVRLRHASQSKPKALWNDHLISVTTDPAPKPSSGAYQGVSTVAMDLAVTLNGAPYPHGSIAVTSDMLVTLLVRGDGTEEQTVWVGDGDVPTFKTDGAGRARVRLWAKSLGFPRLGFQASSAGPVPGGSSPPNVSETRVCRGDVVDNYEPPACSVASRLAGDGDASKADPFSLTPAALMTKQQTGPTTKPVTATYSLLPSGTSSSDGDDVVKLLHQVGTFMKSKSPSYGAQSAPIVATSWTVSTDGHSITSITSADSPPDLSLDGFLDDLGDALHYVAHCVDAAASWTIHVAGDAISFAVGAFKCLVNTAEEAGALVCTILHSIQKGIADIETFIRDVVAFLEMLFDWDDILRTHRVFMTMMNFCLDRAQSSVLKTTVDGKIEKFKDRIDTWLASLAPDKRQPVTQSASGAADKASGQTGTLYGTTNAQHLHQHASRCRYVLSHAQHNVTPGQSSSSSGMDPNGVIAGHWNTPTAQQHAQDLKKQVNDASTAASVFSAPPSSVLIDIFTGLADIALDGIEAVLDFILSALAEMAQDLSTILHHHIDIFLITWIYEDLLDAGSLDLLNLLSLAAAVPATILFKILTEEVSPINGSAPFDAATENALSILFSTADGATLGPNVKGFSQALSGPQGPRAMPPGAGSGSRRTPDLQAVADPRASGVPLPGSGDASDPVKAVAMGLGVMSSVIGLAVSAVSIYVDYQTIEAAQIEPPPQPSGFVTFLSWFQTAAGLLSTALLVPITTWTDPDQTAEGEFWASAYWVSQFGPIAADAVALYADARKTEMVPGFGPIAESLLGILIASAGAVYLAEAHGSAWDIANVVTTCIPRPFRILIAMIVPDTPETAGDAGVVEAVILTLDGVGLLGGVITGVGAAIADNLPSPPAQRSSRVITGVGAAIADNA